MNGLVNLTDLDADGDVVMPNLGALFSEHLVGLTMKPFKGTTRKRDTIGSLLTLIFMHLDIRLDEGTTNRFRLYLDEAHLTSV